MSWREGGNILIKGLSIIESHTSENTERAIYLSGFIIALCDQDFDYMQFRESYTPYDKLLDYVDKRDDIYIKAFSKVKKKLRDNVDQYVLSNYLIAAQRNIQHAEFKKLKVSSASRIEAFLSIWDISSEYIDDEESLHYYTQSLINGFLFSPDAIDEIVKRQKKLAPIFKLIKKEEEIAHERLQKPLKKTKNIQELDEIFGKLEADVKRSLTIHSKNSQEQLTSKTKTKKASISEPLPDKDLSSENATIKYSDPGFLGAINSSNKQHIKLVAERTGQNVSDVQATLQAYEECLLEDLEKKNKTYLLTIMRLRASFKEAKPQRQGINPFTGEEMLLAARPAGLKVSAYETSRLKELLNTIFGNLAKPLASNPQKSAAAEVKGAKTSKVKAKKKRVTKKKSVSKKKRQTKRS